MEKRQLLVISGNEEWEQKIRWGLGFSFGLSRVTGIHAGYSMALTHLPDIILLDLSSIDPGQLGELPDFKSNYFLKKSQLLLYGKRGFERQLADPLSQAADRVLFDDLPLEALWREMEEMLRAQQGQTDSWKDSFMGLLNLISKPVVLLQHEHILEMNDAFRKYFFVTNRAGRKLSDFVTGRSRQRVLETLQKLGKGKRMRTRLASELLLMNKKQRRAALSFSKLGHAGTLRGQLLMMVHFEEQEPLDHPPRKSAHRGPGSFLTNEEIRERFRFTNRELEVIDLLCKGYKTKEISEILCISVKTIEKHRANIIKRTHSDTILESIVFALNNKLITL